MTVDRRN